MSQNKPEKTILRQVFEASTVGIHLVLSMAVGLAMGYGIDYLFNTFPIFSIIFFIMGVIAGFREVFRVAKKVEKINDTADNDKKNL